MVVDTASSRARHALRALAFVSLVALAPQLARPEEGKGGAAVGTDDWYYTVDEGGESVFIQVLSWQGDENARSYEVEVQNKKGKSVLSESTDRPRLEVSLPAGEYRYRVAVVNLLGKREVEGEWVGFTIKKAIDPQIEWITPNHFFFETGDFTLSIGGARFDQGVAVLLVGPGSDEIAGDVQEATRGRITVAFPPDALSAGTYQVKVVNKSGLFALSSERIRVSYEYPYEFYVSAGYMPFIPLIDPWFTDMWSDPVYPAGGAVRAGVMFVRRESWRFGAELRLVGRGMAGGDSVIGMDATVLQADLGLAYKRVIGERLCWLARAGGGFAATSIAYSYNGYKVREEGSFDATCYLGLGAQYRFFKHVFAELAVDYEMTFYKDFVVGGLAPTLSVGYAR